MTVYSTILHKIFIPVDQFVYFLCHFNNTITTILTLHILSESLVSEKPNLGKTLAKHPCCPGQTHSNPTKYCKVSLMKQMLPSGSKATTSASTSVTPTNKVYRNLFPLLQSKKSSYIQYRTQSLFILGAAFVSLAKRSHMQKTVPCSHTQLSVHCNSEFLPVL